MKESVEEKGQSLRSMDVAVVSQRVWREAPDNRMLGSARDLRLGSTMADYADARNGLSAGDSARFERLYWEVGELGSTWELLQSSPSKSGYFSGQSKVVRWERERGQIAQLAESVRHLNHAAQSWRRGKPLWGRHGVVVSQIGAKVSIYTGERYDGSCFAIVPSSPDHVLPLMAYAFSGRLKDDLEAINPTWNLKSPETLLQLPFRPPDWEQAAEDMFGARIPLVPTDNPSQWPFSGAVATSLAPLHVAVARLLGYRWPNQTDDRHFEHSDIDGIICLQSVRGEERADQRMLALMRDADCEERLPASTLDGFVSGPGLRGRGAPWWMLNKLFEEHCKLFSQRPFIWHVWDGRDDGFNALVNAHKLAGAGGEGRRTLEALTYSYLGDWIARQRADQAAGVEGADARLAAAQDLQGQLENILVGEPPHDVFVRWKPLHEQPIGWDPDINDGIRVNIRPFMNAQLRSGGKKGAGILRWKPNIKWGKDRGKEPESLRPREDFPWFWGCPGKGPVDERTDFPGGNGYDGARWNDLHYSNAVKQTARDRAARAPGS
ncbi:MAG: hypothetical protein HN341_08295 [Verrucomicrobia bacterium]|nr:hypothetical protein [Verrucomicrobiota bacterium]